MMAKIERVAILNMMSFYHVLHGVAMPSNEKKCEKLPFRFDKPV